MFDGCGDGHLCAFGPDYSHGIGFVSVDGRCGCGDGIGVRCGGNDGGLDRFFGQRHGFGLGQRGTGGGRGDRLGHFFPAQGDDVDDRGGPGDDAKRGGRIGRQLQGRAGVVPFTLEQSAYDKFAIVGIADDDPLRVTHTRSRDPDAAKTGSPIPERAILCLEDFGRLDVAFDQLDAVKSRGRTGRIAAAIERGLAARDQGDQRDG